VRVVYRLAPSPLWHPASPRQELLRNTDCREARAAIRVRADAMPATARLVLMKASTSPGLHEQATDAFEGHAVSGVGPALKRGKSVDFTGYWQQRRPVWRQGLVHFQFTKQAAARELSDVPV
jgi:hypothetical protein